MADPNGTEIRLRFVNDQALNPRGDAVVGQWTRLAETADAPAVRPYPLRLEGRPYFRAILP